MNLLTYHRAKGLEFDAVFLPRLIDGELPFRSDRAKADPQEERRLLDVGITRARRYLFITWAADRETRPSPFLQELGISRAKSHPTRPHRGTPVGSVADRPLLQRLKEWRRKRAHADSVPAYVVFHDQTLAEIAGVGPTKLDRYADEILEILGPMRADERGKRSWVTERPRPSGSPRTEHRTSDRRRGVARARRSAPESADGDRGPA